LRVREQIGTAWILAWQYQCLCNRRREFLLVFRHDECAAATAYRQHLRERYEREAQTLATLTGWNIGEIRKAMNIVALPANDDKKWYQRLWSN